MPQIQELMGVPSFGGQLGQALGGGLGQGISQGLSKQLESFHKAKAFEKAGLPRAYADLDPVIVSQILKQEQKNKLIESILNPEGQQPSTLEAITQNSQDLSQNPLEASRLQSSSGNLARQNAGRLSPQQRTALHLADPNLGRAEQKEEQFRIQQEAPIRKSEIKRSEKFLDKIEDSRKSVQRAKSSLIAAETALADRDLGFFSRDNLANLTGVEALRSKEGAVFNAAAKNFFLADLESAVGRPNQFLEKILTKAIFDVGKSNEANDALLKFYKNQVDIDEKKIEITDQLEDFYAQKLGYVPGNIGRLVDAQLKPYAQAKEKELESQFKNQGKIQEKSQNPVAVNPKTGQKLELKDGKWRPIK